MIKFIGKTTNGTTLMNGEFESWEELYFESLNNDLLFNNALEIAIAENSGDNVHVYELEEKYNITSDGLDTELFKIDFEDYEPTEEDFKDAVIYHSEYYQREYEEVDRKSTRLNSSHVSISYA